MTIMKIINIWHLQSFFRLNIPKELNELYGQIDQELHTGETKHALQTTLTTMQIKTSSFYPSLQTVVRTRAKCFLKIIKMEDNSKQPVINGPQSRKRPWKPEGIIL